MADEMHHYPIDTVDDANVWVMGRRVHWYADDLIAHQLHKRNIRTAERRLLDALFYVDRCGIERASTAVLCALTPTLKSQTAASVLDRLRRAELIGGDTSDGGRIRRWWLAEAGRKTREDYCGEAERQLQVLFDTRSGESVNALLDRVPAALDLVESRLFPRVQYHAAGEAVRPAPPSTPWSALRRVHLHLSDHLYHETELFGIGPVERRVLDALGYARKMCVPCLNVGTLCRLSEAVTRTVVQTALDNLRMRRLVEMSGETGRILWSLTAIGDSAREAYKRCAQLRLREFWDPDQIHSAELLDLMRRAHEHRDRRLQHALGYFNRRGGTRA